MNHTKHPVVSVVIPTWNGQIFIADTLTSILAQTHRGLEIVVVDDESSEDTVAVVNALADPRIRLVQQRNGGVSSARNTGIAASRGDFIAFSDQDDIWHPRKLELQLQALAGLSGRWLSCTAFRFWAPDGEGHYPPWAGILTDQAGTSLDPSLSGWAYHQMLLESYVLTSTALLSREDAELIGAWDATLKYGEDWDYWLRASRVAQFAFLKAPLVAYRQNPSQGSRKPRAENWSEKVLQRAVAQWGMRGPDGRTPDPKLFRRRRAINWQGFSALHLEAGSRRLICSVRIVCLNGPDGVRAIRAAWKVAVPPNHTDNFGMGDRGNLLADVDLASGEISRVIDGFWPRTEEHSNHPVTGLPFKGFRLPDWPMVLKICQRAGEVSH